MSNPVVLYDFLVASQKNGFSWLRQAWITKPLKTCDRVLRAIVILAQLLGRDGDKGPLTVTHEDIASIVDADRASVSASLKILEREGLVKLGYRKIWLSDARGVKQMEVLLSQEFEQSMLYPRLSDLSARDNQRLLMPLDLSALR
jgi:hypothetical protein